MVLVPFPGFLYLYHSPAVNRHEEKCSRPLPGVLISLQRTERAEASRISVLVPFPGFLYLYAVIAASGDSRLMVLVPFPGFLYLYMLVELLRIAVSTFSSPSRGSYISTRNSKSDGKSFQRVLVPFPGFLYLYIAERIKELDEEESSRPLPGVLISLHSRTD